MFDFLKKKKAPSHPSTPMPFGYKTGWFAFQTDPNSVIETMATTSEPIDWETAIERLTKRKPFLTPEFDGWCLLSETSEEIASDLKKLHVALGCDVAYFESHRGVGGAAYGWTKDGAIVRVHSQADGELLEDFGPISVEEKQLGIVPIDFNDDTEYSPQQEDEMWQANPDEEHVLQLAGLISIDPSTIDRYEPSLPFSLKLRNWR